LGAAAAPALPQHNSSRQLYITTMSGHGGHSYVVETPVFRPSKEDFSKPFCDYVNKVLKKNPDIPMFKVVPPAGWKPRK
jgi:hypothetical protein